MSQADPPLPPLQPVTRLKAERVELQLAQMPGWRVQQGGATLARRFRFPSPGAALAFAGLVTSLAERFEREPRILLKGNELCLSLTSGGGLTREDLAFARRIHEQM